MKSKFRAAAKKCKGRKQHAFRACMKEELRKKEKPLRMHIRGDWKKP